MAEQTIDRPKQGVLAQHRDRMETDLEYRAAALSLDPDAPGGAALGKHVESDVPTSLSSSPADAGDDIDSLSGDELDQAVRDANIEGRSSMNADEKRAALRESRS